MSEFEDLVAKARTAILRNGKLSPEEYGRLRAFVTNEIKEWYRFLKDLDNICKNY